jgi:hypothetical protein
LRYPLDIQKEKLHYPFTFIIGASGSGTTMLSRILCSPSAVIGIDDFKDVPVSDKVARSFVDKFKIITETLWDRTASTEDYRKAKSAFFQIVDDLFKLEFYKHADRLVHKRSAPFFWGDRFRPDISDIFDVFANPKVIVIYRDPSESTYSSLRRGFGTNLKHLAVICEDQLTYINSHLSILNENSYKVITYEDLCSHPIETITELAEFAQLDLEELKQATIKEEVTPTKMGRWRQALPPEDVNFLDAFFNERRLAQWSILSNPKKK